MRENISLVCLTYAQTRDFCRNEACSTICPMLSYGLKIVPFKYSLKYDAPGFKNFKFDRPFLVHYYKRSLSDLSPLWKKVINVLKTIDPWSTSITHQTNKRT